MNRWRVRTIAAAIAVMAVATLSACGVPTDDAPRDIEPTPPVVIGFVARG